MTYGELLEALYELTPEQLQQEVSLYDMKEGEYLPTAQLKIAKNKDTDVGNPYIPF